MKKPQHPWNATGQMLKSWRSPLRSYWSTVPTTRPSHFMYAVSSHSFLSYLSSPRSGQHDVGNQDLQVKPRSSNKTPRLQTLQQFPRDAFPNTERPAPTRSNWMAVVNSPLDSPEHRQVCTLLATPVGRSGQILKDHRPSFTSPCPPLLCM